MPTREILASFWRDWDGLTSEQQSRFRAGLAKFIEDLSRGEGFRSSLRAKGVRHVKSVYEMTWAADGRATFEYGRSVRTGELHIRWRRIGTHEILREP